MTTSALRDLIEGRRKATGRSYADVADRADGVITRSAIHRLATADIQRLPEPRVINALAKGLDIEPAEILKAAGESVGIVTEPLDTPTDRHSRAIVSGLGEMSEDERETVARVVEGLLRGR